MGFYLAEFTFRIITYFRKLGATGSWKDLGILYDCVALWVVAQTLSSSGGDIFWR